MRTLFAFAAVLVLSLSLSVRAGEVIVGTNAEFPPFELTDDNNNIIGFDIDVVKAVGRAAGLDVRMHNQDFDTLVEGLESGKLHAVISGMTITEARRLKVDFSDPYYDAAQVIVIRDNAPAFTAIEELKGKRVGAQLGTTGALMVEEALGKDNDNLKQFTKYNEVFAELRLRRLDAVVVDLPVAQAYLKKVPGLKISSEPMSQEQYGIAVKKGNAELLAKINEGLAKIRESGEFDEISAKWFD